MTKEKAGVYVRLSRDEDKENYDSLETQRDALLRYAKENNIEVFDVYADDNVSGYLFNERPEFNRMLKDLYSNKFDTILAKDLSRIGRNNARVLLFLEELSMKDKRLVLVDRNYDSFKDDDDIIGIESWVNERYVKDISKKVRFNLKEKQKAGELLIRPTFGYHKEGHDLVVNQKTAPIVKEIFSLYRQGYGYRKITLILNEKKYPTPSMIEGTKRPTTDLWNATQVSRILKNDIYIGTLSLRKTIRKAIKSRELVKIPEEEWIKIEDNHEPIISKKEFYRVQEIIAERNKKRLRAGKGKINLFAGYIFCHDCGSPMFCIKNKRFATHYQCGSYFKYGLEGCTSHRIMEKSLVATILAQLNTVVENIKETLSSVDSTILAQSKTQKNYSGHIDKLKKEIDNEKKGKMIIYKDKVKGIISEEMYLELTKEIDTNLKLLNQQLEKLEKLRNNASQSAKMLKTYLDLLEEVVEKGLLTRETINQFIDKIEINKDKEIELIKWKIAIEPMVQ